MQNLILIGGGGHCKSCIDVIEQTGKFQIAGIVDVPEKLHQKVLGYEIIATDDDLQTTDTETSIELNFAVLKFKHTIKKKNKRETHKIMGLMLCVFLSY